MPPIPGKEVIEAIVSAGCWSRHEEWRISTVTSTEIVRTGDLERHRAYKVRVECDFVFEAYCPTITRSIEVATVYERLVQRLWHEMGWPGWASQHQLEPEAGAV
jgi:hypothetical protein